MNVQLNKNRKEDGDLTLIHSQIITWTSQMVLDCGNKHPYYHEWHKSENPYKSQREGYRGMCAEKLVMCIDAFEMGS